MNFKDIDILELLPQQPPFVMIDKLVYCDMENTITKFLIRNDNIFCDMGEFSESGLVENIAQTCAARMGYINRYVNNESVMLGFIGAIKNMEIFRLPKVNEQLITKISVIEEIFQMTLVKATTTSNEELISSCEMKISVSDLEKLKMKTRNLRFSNYPFLNN